MLSDLLLLSGNDIPFPEARVSIHQPTLKEIAFLGEEQFFLGCGFLDFSKDLLKNSDKVNLAQWDDFDIFMSIMIDNNIQTKKSTEAAMNVLMLIFPLYDVSVRTNAIVLKQGNEEFLINKNNFGAFKNILSAMFNLKFENDKQEEYNPQGDLAKRIAEKFKKRHETLANLQKDSALMEKEEEKRVSILSRYISILAVGLQKDLNDLMQYTVYQLYDEFQRFQLKIQWDAYLQARMAGAKDLEEVDNWMIDLRDQKNKNKK